MFFLNCRGLSIRILACEGPDWRYESPGPWFWYSNGFHKAVLFYSRWGSGLEETWSLVSLGSFRAPFLLLTPSMIHHVRNKLLVLCLGLLGYNFSDFCIVIFAFCFSELLSCECCPALQWFQGASTYSNTSSIPSYSWILAVEWGVMLAAVVPGLFSPAGGQAVAGDLKQLCRVCCACAHRGWKCFVNLTAWLPLTGTGEDLRVAPCQTAAASPKPCNSSSQCSNGDYKIWMCTKASYFNRAGATADNVTALCPALV